MNEAIPMKNTSYRIGFFVFVIANLGLISYGALLLVKPGILLNAFTLHIYRFPESAARAEGYLEALFRLLGYFNGILGVLGLLLLRRWRITHEIWLPRITSISSILAYIGPIVFDNTVGSIGFFEIVEYVLFALVIIFSIILWREK